MEDKLNELTKKVIALVDMVCFTDEGAKYETVKGTCTCRNILNIGSIAILYAVLDEDTELVEHLHDDAVETIICSKGIFISMVGGIKQVLTPGESLTIQPKVPHIAKTITGCEVVGITIPASPGYPKQKQDG